MNVYQFNLYKTMASLGFKLCNFQMLLSEDGQLPNHDEGISYVYIWYALYVQVVGFVTIRSMICCLYTKDLELPTQ
jgi:hypothetical protein